MPCGALGTAPWRYPSAFRRRHPAPPLLSGASGAVRASFGCKRRGAGLREKRRRSRRFGAAVEANAAALAVNRLDLAQQGIAFANRTSDKGVDQPFVEHLRAVDLLDDPLVENGDAVRTWSVPHPGRG